MYEISEASYNALYRHFVEGGSEITYKEGLRIASDLKKCREKKRVTNSEEFVTQQNSFGILFDNEFSKPDEKTGEKVYFDVFYADRNGAKELGAKWDKEHKLWYAYEGTEICDRLRTVFDVKDIDTLYGKY